MQQIFWPVIIVTVIGLLSAGMLVIAAKIMHVEEDPRIGEVSAAMPGANCGACGYAGCVDYAKAIVAGTAKLNLCIPGGAATAQAVAELMGTVAGEVLVQKAVVACQGNLDNTHDKYRYQGVTSCTASTALFSGSSACTFGCLGYGDCKAACKFDAIIVENGLARIDRDKCTGCGACKAACPKKIIALIPLNENPMVLCMNREKGAVARKQCKTACIACMICQKACPTNAITVNDNIAVIDQEKCINCGECVAKCPQKCIKPLKGTVATAAAK